MLKKILQATALLAAIAAPLPEAAARAGAAHGKNAYHRGFHVGYRNGYVAGYRQAYLGGGPQVSAAGASSAAAFGAALLGATYGYWSDGVRTYGGDPCYVYNDRDWDFERVC
ncbi:hypothetical protein WOC76_17425 [Methylocystis sp. IM3]|jgi:hypothetical protein|uniref:hypothetical protein n=1 Tax=unclassified Methylocystis TaxID=2625913 RepID=UPI000F962AD5|nr:MAG: hypothetical protein EKK29_04345 [Hyphomicrobiales bacterium]